MLEDTLRIATPSSATDFRNKKQVPIGEFTLVLGKAEVVRLGGSFHESPALTGPLVIRVSARGDGGNDGRDGGIGLGDGEMENGKRRGCRKGVTDGTKLLVGREAPDVSEAQGLQLGGNVGKWRGRGQGGNGLVQLGRIQE